MEQNGLTGGVVEVEYLEGLRNPDELVQDRIYQIVFERDRDTRLGLFAIKPSAHEFEHEIRAILYPKRNYSDPVKIRTQPWRRSLYQLASKAMG